MDIKIPLLPVQKDFITATEDFVAIVSGRSCGKTWIGVLDALLEVLKGNNILYMCQNDGAWYKGGWVHLQKFLREFKLLEHWSWNSTYKTGTLFGKKFYVGTYENVDGARGATECSTLYLDEFMLSKPSIMAALAPCLRGKDAQGNDVNPRIRAFSSPNMESLWQLMIVEAAKYGIRVLRSKQSDNTFLTEKQKSVMNRYIFDPRLRAQEIDGEIILDGGQTAIINVSDFTNVVQLFHDNGVYAGLDMAHKGQRDSHVFCAVQGNRLLALHEFGTCDHMEVASWIKRFHERYPIYKLNIDLAWSELVYEQLRFTINCQQRSFAERPPVEDEKVLLQYANIRSWGYFRFAQHTRDGLVWDVESEFIDKGVVSELKREACHTHFLLDRMGRILIEPKEDIKARLGRSPDVADAAMLACIDRPGLLDPAMVAREQQADSRERDELEAIMSED
ncbi:hypothetical protein [uncultured Fibrobacter sp.]|uniref:hypothetical protein n=1 Tax=uncultured Fibrobacter sp. TaxID=261512 RepID=UPI0025F727D8|nr:hypothetical protein [uncultured Fibrobacter sp.]